MTTTDQPPQLDVRESRVGHPEQAVACRFDLRQELSFPALGHHHRVLESEAEAFRLALCQATKSVIARSLDLSPPILEQIRARDNDPGAR